MSGRPVWAGGGPADTLGDRVRAHMAWANPLTQIEAGSFVANIKSQIKRNRTNERARLRNKATKSSLKTAVKKFRSAADAGDTAAATEALKDASRELDKAASKGVIHKNQAANRKSAMASRLAKQA